MSLPIRSLIICLGYIIFQTILACHDDEGGCPYVKNTEITGSISDINFEYAHATWQYGSLGFYFYVDFTIAEESRKLVHSFQGFMQQAIATTPCPTPLTYFVYTNPIDSVAITADKPYNQDVGRDVTSLIMVEYNNFSLEDALKQHNTESTYGAVEISSDEQIVKYKGHIVSAPQQSDTFRFSIRLVDIHGKVFTASSDPIFMPAD